MLSYSCLRYSQQQEEIPVTIINDGDTNQKVYIYGKKAVVAPSISKEGMQLPGQFRLIHPQPSMLLLPEPILVPARRSVTVPVSIPKKETYVLPTRTEFGGNPPTLPRVLTEIDLRIQYWTQWCKKVIPLIQTGPGNKINYLDQITITVSAIGSGECLYGWIYE